MLFPTQSALNEAFSSPPPFSSPRAKKPTSAPNFSVWSVAEDAKSKAGALSSEAAKEIQKASSTAQAKTGQIELYSTKYYAACTFGGLIACVGILIGQYRKQYLMGEAGSHTYSGDPTRFGQMPSTG